MTEEKREYNAGSQPPIDDPVVGEHRGMPREPYRRNYILFSRKARYGYLWWQAVALANSVLGYSMGTSPDDVGSSDLDERFCIAINPQDIGNGLTQGWFDQYYPGTVMDAIEAETPWEAAVKLLPRHRGDPVHCYAVLDTDFGEHPGGSNRRKYYCLLHSFCIILRSFYSADVTPAWLDRLLATARVAIEADAILVFEGFAQMFPVFDSTIRQDGKPEPRWLAEMLKDNCKIILRSSIDFTHHVYLDGVENEDLRVIDTLDGVSKIWATDHVGGILSLHIGG
jgi:hypothetical protein